MASIRFAGAHSSESTTECHEGIMVHLSHKCHIEFWSQTQIPQKHSTTRNASTNHEALGVTWRDCGALAVRVKSHGMLVCYAGKMNWVIIYLGVTTTYSVTHIPKYRNLMDPELLIAKISSFKVMYSSLYRQAACIVSAW